MACLSDLVIETRHSTYELEMDDLKQMIVSGPSIVPPLPWLSVFDTVQTCPRPLDENQKGSMEHFGVLNTGSSRLTFYLHRHSDYFKN